MSHGKQAHGHTFSRHDDNSLCQITGNGLYSVELVVKDGSLFVGSNSIFPRS